MANQQVLGAEGEALAAKWLSEKGFELLHRNWRFGHCEVDIIASLDLCFIS